MRMAAIRHSISSLFHSYTEALATLGTVTVTCLATLGVVTVTCLTLIIVYLLWCFIKIYLLAKPLGLNTNIKSLGSWAVVTGSTDGIGKAYAEQLAELGLNVVLISRSADKLAAVAEGIEKQYKVKTKCIAVDFTGDMIIYNTIGEGLKGLDIAVLVNNVGMFIDFPMYMAEATDKCLSNVITVNCYSVTFMSKLVLPKMMEKGKGLIINVSSLSGFRPMPMIAVYSATKAFIEFLSAAMAEEYKSKGIIIQCVTPGYVVSKMSKIRKPSFFVPSPDYFVRSALATVGLAARSDGCIAHALQAFGVLLLPQWIHYKILISIFKPARAQALKKQQQQKTQ